MAAQYRIGEFAYLGGVSAKTLRFYDEIGLLRPASVDARTGYRQYRPEQLEELLKRYDGNVADVSRELGKHRAAVWRRIKKFGLGPQKFRRTE